jgi:hypothetical protein
VKPAALITIDKQSVIDIGWSVLGGLIGGAATAAFLVSRFMRAKLGAPDEDR